MPSGRPAPPPEDDWSDDFDLAGADRSFGSSSSSSSAASRLSLGGSGGGRKMGSPLRQMHTRSSHSARTLPPDEMMEIDEDFDFDDLPDAFGGSAGHTIKGLPAAAAAPSLSTPRGLRTIPPPTAAAGPSSSAMRSFGLDGLSQLAAASKPPKPPVGLGLPAGSVLARAKMFEGGDGAGTTRLKKVTVPLSRTLPVADPDALDAMGFDLDDDEDQDTLKAGATIKAMLPPPRRRDNSSSASGNTDTIRASGPLQLSSTVRSARLPEPPKGDDEDMEDGFALPLNLQNLRLATQSASLQSSLLQPRRSPASVTEDWDSPSNASTSGRKAGPFWGDESSGGQRTSETSITSVSDESHDKHNKGDDDFDAAFDDEEDYEADLVIPEPAFFSARKLESILHQKRLQQYAPPPPPECPHAETSRGDDSFEDGLVLDNKSKFTKRQMDKTIKTRSRGTQVTLVSPFSFDRPKTTDKEHLLLRKNVTAAGRGGAPLGHTSGTSTTGQPRSVSGGALAPKDSSRSRPESPLVVTRELTLHRAPSRARLTSGGGGGGNMAPPPVPSTSSSTAAVAASSSSRTEQTTPSRQLRSRKSMHHLQQSPAPAPKLSRKQSLPSLQDAVAAGHVRPDADALRNPPSTSSLMKATSSTLAKVRPALHNNFPAAGAARARVRSGGKIEQRVINEVKPRQLWGDGAEDNIEDLLAASPPPAARPRKLGDKSPSSTLRGMPKELQSKRRPQRKPPVRGFVQHLGEPINKKVGEMTFNKQTMRWEGNESALRIFDNIPSTRPALITHLTGSSLSSPQNTAPAPRIVGDMMFDTQKMLWVSLIPSEEPDPFEDMADDEESDTSSARGSGSYSRASGRRLMPMGMGAMSSIAPSSAALSSRFVSDSRSIAALSTASGDDRMQLSEYVSAALLKECNDACERHSREMRGWTLKREKDRADAGAQHGVRDDPRLWAVRRIAGGGSEMRESSNSNSSTKRREREEKRERGAVKRSTAAGDRGVSGVSGTGSVYR